MNNKNIRFISIPILFMILNNLFVKLNMDTYNKTDKYIFSAYEISQWNYSMTIGFFIVIALIFLIIEIYSFFLVVDDINTEINDIINRGINY